MEVNCPAVEGGAPIKSRDPPSKELQSDVLKAVQEELDRLLSRANITTDPSIASLMLSDWSIPAASLISHPSLSHFALSPEDLLSAASTSSIIRPNLSSVTVTPELQAKRTTLILRSLPPDTTVNELKSILLQKPITTNDAHCDGAPPTSTDTITDASPTRTSESFIHNVRLDSSGCWYVTFSDEEVTQDFAVWLRSQKFRDGDYFRVAVKNSRCLQSSIRPPQTLQGSVYLCNAGRGLSQTLLMQSGTSARGADMTSPTADTMASLNPNHNPTPRGMGKETPGSAAAGLPSPEGEACAVSPPAGLEEGGLVSVMSTGGHEHNLNTLKVFPISIASSGAAGQLEARGPHHDIYLDGHSPHAYFTGGHQQFIDPTLYPYQPAVDADLAHCDPHYLHRIPPMKQADNGVGGQHSNRGQGDRRQRNRTGPPGDWPSRAMWRGPRRGHQGRAPAGKPRHQGGPFNSHPRRGDGWRSGDQPPDGADPQRPARTRQQRQPPRNGPVRGPAPNSESPPATFVPDEQAFPSLSESIELKSSPSSGALKQVSGASRPHKHAPAQHKRGTENGKGGRSARDLTLGDHWPLPSPTGVENSSGDSDRVGSSDRLSRGAAGKSRGRARPSSGDKTPFQTAATDEVAGSVLTPRPAEEVSTPSTTTSRRQTDRCNAEVAADDKLCFATLEAGAKEVETGETVSSRGVFQTLDEFVTVDGHAPAADLARLGVAVPSSQGLSVCLI